MALFKHLDDKACEVEILNENCEVVKLLEVENLSKVAKLGSKALLRADIAALFA